MRLNSKTHGTRLRTTHDDRKVRQIGVEFDARDFEALVAWANEEERTISGQIRYIVRAALAERTTGGAKDAE